MSGAQGAGKGKGGISTYGEDGEPLFSIFYTSVDYIDIYLNNVLADATYYGELLQALRGASDYTSIKLYINSPGGQLHTALQIINAMRDSPATIHATIDVECHSAASFIFLAADTWRVTEHSFMLCHSYSTGVYGKGHELASEYHFEKERLDNLIDVYYKDFLTKKEISELKLGRDIYLNSEEIAARLPSS